MEIKEDTHYWIKVEKTNIPTIEALVTLLQHNYKDSDAMLVKSFLPDAGIYCQECNACGISDCCRPSQCLHSDIYQNDWDELQAENSAYYEKYGPIDQA